MAEVVEGGASLAWRLLATLEGGSLLLAASALLAYSARRQVAKLNRTRRPVRHVLLTNTSNILGKELKTRLETNGCIVHTISEVSLNRAIHTDGLTNSTTGASDATSVFSDATSERSEVSGVTSGTTEAVLKYDALIVVGAFSPPKLSGLDGMAKLVSEDVYSNLKFLESLSSLVHRRGYMAWACAGAASAGGSWENVGDAFDTVLKANLERVAKVARCEAVWVGRCSDPEQAAQKLVKALISTEAPQAPGRLNSIRNAANKVGEYVGRWLKIVT